MAVKPITTDMVNDAGIAASIAANVNIIPEPSVYLQDFTFGATMFEAAYGNAESLSGVGAGVADVATDTKLKLEEEERKKDDPALDTGLITEIAERQREATARYSDGHFYFRGMKLTTDEMNEALQMTRDNLPEIARREGWSDEKLAREERRIDAAMAETDPQLQAVLIGEIERDNPVLAEELENNAKMVVQGRANNELTGVEAQDANILNMAEPEERQEIAASVLDVTESYEVAVMAENNLTIGDNPFADTRSPASEFNAQASGNVQFAEAMPPQNAPVVSGPVLSNG